MRITHGETALSSGTPRRSHAAERAARLQTRSYDFESKTNTAQSAAAAATRSQFEASTTRPAWRVRRTCGFGRALLPDYSYRRDQTIGVDETACRSAFEARGVEVDRDDLQSGTRPTFRLAGEGLSTLPARVARPASLTEGTWGQVARAWAPAVHEGAGAAAGETRGVATKVG